ncbi:MAG: hypothetical protein H0U76_09935 [Ktedonobacteraceae bacterium]|nr:hypothetical protein [Ktedonobacteraceae bacterium]
MLDEFPSTNPLYLGQVRISIDQEQFLDAIGYGLLSYFESDDVEKWQMSAQELLHDFLATLRDDTPLPWNLGFILGRFAGLLNPDIQEDDPRLTYLESLSQKCEKLYGASAKKLDTVAPDDLVQCLNVVQN